MKACLVLFACLFSCMSYGQNVDWFGVTSAGGTGYDNATAVKMDAALNVYTIGRFESDSLVWGGKVIYVDKGCMFLSKHNKYGHLTWLKNIPMQGFATALDVDSKGNCYVTGYCAADSIVFGLDTLQTDTNGSYDIFLLKFDSSGNGVWGKTAGGNNQEYGYSVKRSYDGSIYVAGSKGNDTMYFGADVLINNSGSENVVLLKYDSLGNEVWARNSTLGYNAMASGVATDRNGNCYIVGNYYGAPVVFGNTTLANNVQDDEVFIVKYTPQGNIVWAQKAGGPGKDWAQSISIDFLFGIVISGATASSSFNYGSITMTSPGTQLFDGYILKVDTLGTPVWWKRFGGTDNERGNAITIDEMGDVIVAGQFASTVFGIANKTLTTKGAYDIYVAKYYPNGSAQWVISAGDSLADIATGIAADGGAIYACGAFFSKRLIVNADTLQNNGKSDVFLGILYESSSVKNVVLNTASLSAYPNPFTSRICTSSIDDSVVYTLMNSIGKLVWQGREIEKHDFSVLPPGLYILRAEGRQESAKLLKQ